MKNLYHQSNSNNQPLSKRAKLVFAMILAVPIFQQAAHAAPAIVIDTSASVQPALSNIGVTPSINIATPNSAGVSHNKFTEFNVGQSGLILNNSTTDVNTVLGDAVAANPLLNGRSASIILNEVTGKNASTLNGGIEVVGANARVIIANPNGIIANSAHFTNADHVSLVAGKVVLDRSGNIDTFTTDAGEIRIEGMGLDASSTKQVDLVTRTLLTNANLQKNKITLVTAKGEFDAATLTKKDAVSSDKSTKDIAIDVAQLGGMHADSIRLVGKESGVGVNVGNEVDTLTGNLSLTSNGLAVSPQSSSIQVKQTGIVDSNNASLLNKSETISTLPIAPITAPEALNKPIIAQSAVTRPVAAPVAARTPNAVAARPVAAPIVARTPAVVAARPVAAPAAIITPTAVVVAKAVVAPVVAITPVTVVAAKTLAPRAAIITPAVVAAKTVVASAVAIPPVSIVATKTVTAPATPITPVAVVAPNAVAASPVAALYSHGPAVATSSTQSPLQNSTSTPPTSFNFNYSGGQLESLDGKAFTVPYSTPKTFSFSYPM
jgi:filamentous hemagglutinin family protein